MYNTFFRYCLLSLILSLTAFSAERFNGQCRTDNGQVSDACVVTVYDAGTLDLSSIYSDEGLGSAKANPFTGDNNGQAFFYAADGDYDVVYTGGVPSIGTFTIASVRLGDNDVGTVTSVGISAPTNVFDVGSSPVTGTGTLALTFDTQAINLVFAGPGSGSAATPTFRALIDEDIPDLDMLSSGMVNGCVEVVSGVLTSLGVSCGVTAGTVTSVGLSMPSGFSVANSPLTSSGTLAVTFSSTSESYVLIGPESGSGVPTQRALVATDIPNLPASSITTGTFADARIAESSITQHEAALTFTNMLGTLGVTKGGTGLTSAALGDIFYGSAANTISRLSGNTSATKAYLSQTGDGANSAAPAWGAIAAGDLPASIDAAKIGGGDVSSTEYNYLNGVTSAIQTQLDAKIASSVTLTAGVGLSGGGDLSSNRTFTFDPTELDSLVWDNGSASSYTWTFDLNSGTDPIITFTPGTINVSTGAFQVGGNAVLTSASTHVLLGTTHSDTDPQSVTRGSMIIGNSTPAWTELVIGSANKVLATDGTDPSWTTLAKAHLPSALPYEDEANTFTLGQVIDGTSDVNQLRVQGHSTQTNDVFVLEDNSGGDILAIGIQASVKGAKFGTKIVGGDMASVASASALALTNVTNAFVVTGTTTITSMTTCDSNNNGRIVQLIFADALTFTDGSNLFLAGDFITTTDDTIMLLCSGISWFELSRSVN